TIKQAHVLEPYWNWSRMSQVIGRAVRFCSHKDLPKDERYVDVYIYITKHSNIEKTVDQYIQELADKKRSLTEEFEKSLKESAVDCRLNKKANKYKGDKEIKCAR